MCLHDQTPKHATRQKYPFMWRAFSSTSSNELLVCEFANYTLTTSSLTANGIYIMRTTWSSHTDPSSLLKYLARSSCILLGEHVVKSLLEQVETERHLVLRDRQRRHEAESLINARRHQHQAVVQARSGHLAGAAGRGSLGVELETNHQAKTANILQQQRDTSASGRG